MPFEATLLREWTQKEKEEKVVVEKEEVAEVVGDDPVQSAAVAVIAPGDDDDDMGEAHDKDALVFLRSLACFKNRWYNQLF